MSFLDKLGISRARQGQNHHLCVKITLKFYISTLNNCEQVSLMSELGFMKYLVSNKVLCIGTLGFRINVQDVYYFLSTMEYTEYSI